jgi:hypothetical protein
MVLSGCSSRYICGPAKSPQVVVGGDHHSISPYVLLTIADGSSTITVGNESAPSLQNDAVIKDFHYGSADGITATFTIHDQRGGSLTRFIERMLKDFNEATSKATKAEFEFGWITTGCPQPIAVNKSTKRYGVILWADTNFAEGKFMYEITVSSVAEVMAESKTTKIFGGDGDKGIPIRQALEELLTDEDLPPSVSKISFKTIKNGQIQDVGFEKPTPGNKNGRKDKWVGNNRGKLQTAIEWLSQNNLSQNKKGWYPYYNESHKGGEIIFWEDNKPLCGENVSPNNCIGTYVVNGGKESSVIEFNPQFKWNYNVLAQGGSAGENKALIHPRNVGKYEGRDDCVDLKEAVKKGAGGESTSPVTSGVKDEEGDKAGEAIEKSVHKMARAVSYSIHDAIESELVVIGDPTLDPVLHGHGAFASIIFINPYHLIGTSRGCPEWESSGLEGSPCNELLSNRAWITKSLSHRISGGKFTTNIRVLLPSPYSDFDGSTPLGGDPLGKKVKGI